MAFSDAVLKELRDRFSPELAAELEKLHSAVFGKPKDETEDS
jgi:hypothetical protein